MGFTPRKPDYAKCGGVYISASPITPIAEFISSTPNIGAKNHKNSSGDEIANVNFLRRYGTYVLQNTKKENLLRLTN